MLFDDLLGHGQAQAGALASFRREERVEDVLLHLRRHAAAIVANADGEPAVLLGRLGAEPDVALGVGRGVDGIAHQVDKAAFDIKLLSADPVSLKWKLQYKKKGKWKVFKVLKDGVKTKLKGEIIINNDQAIVIGTDLAIKAKKFRLILKNQEMNGTIGSYAITEFEGLQ